MNNYEIIDSHVSPPYFITIPPTPDPEPELDVINSGNPNTPEPNSSITEYVQEIERLHRDSEKLEKELVEKAIQRKRSQTSYYRMVFYNWNAIDACDGNLDFYRV